MPVRSQPPLSCLNTVESITNDSSKTWRMRRHHQATAAPFFVASNGLKPPKQVHGRSCELRRTPRGRAATLLNGLGADAVVVSDSEWRNPAHGSCPRSSVRAGLHMGHIMNEVAQSVGGEGGGHDGAPAGQGCSSSRCRNGLYRCRGPNLKEAGGPMTNIEPPPALAFLFRVGVRRVRWTLKC